MSYPVLKCWLMSLYIEYTFFCAVTFIYLQVEGTNSITYDIKHWSYNVLLIHNH